MLKLTDSYRLVTCLCLALSACEAEPAPEVSAQPWSVVASELDEAALSVGGASDRDVWVVGADRGKGPLALHWDGQSWSRRGTGTRGDLWWVHGWADGSAIMGGAGGNLLRWNGEAFEPIATPGLARHTIFGVWGESPDDVYAVGSVAGRDGFIWHYDGDSFREVPLPRDVPLDAHGEVPGLYKVWGNDHDVYAVGASGLLLRGDAQRGFRVVPTGQTAPLYTVFGEGEHVYAVGGELGGVAVQVDAEDHVQDQSPRGAPVIQGVCAGPRGEVIASGELGQIFEHTADGFHKIRTGLTLNVQTLHSVWFDPQGNVWAVGGNAISGLNKGAIVRRGAVLPTYAAPAQTAVAPAPAVCPEADQDPAAERSIARRWNEQLLSAIRRDLPRPTVHARNLYHVSAAMWDAWAAFEPGAKGVFVSEKLPLADADSGRREAISYAAYRVLDHRYHAAVGGAVSSACLRGLMGKLGYDPDDTHVEGSDPRALGNRIAQEIIARGQSDGANEDNNYADTTDYHSANTALVVEGVGAQCMDPSAWQPLNLAQAETQNGIVTPAGVQGYIGAQWNDVTPFAMTRAEPGALYHDPGPAPALGPELREWAAQIVERGAALDATDGEQIDISPGAYGNNSLGANDGQGHPLNPVTGEPYAPQRVLRGDFARVLAEFWADGPTSETPPGHWNVIANEVSSHAGFARRWRGQGPQLDALAWDVRLYLALNGAVHDAAITAWGIKRRTTSARPITLIRYMASKGQSSDPGLPSYDPEGLPLRPGVIELITEQSARPGERHAHLSRHVGELAVRGYRGEPVDRKHQLGGVGWLRALEWIPYQRRTFVTPAFPGFVSGHSTFSRAAAEVLAAASGSPYFPDGLGEFSARADAYLVFERGPSTELKLQWATYYDAADQAGQSRLYGGIHIEPDDFVGRKLGSVVGLDALAHAERFFPAR